MDSRPVVGIRKIHEKFFISEDGVEILSLKALEKLSQDMQEYGAATNQTVLIGGRRRPRIITVEPFFSLWRRDLLCKRRKKGKGRKKIDEKRETDRGGTDLR